MDNYRRSSLNGFTTVSLDRAPHRRRDNQWIAERLKSPSTRIIPLWEMKHFFTDATVPLMLSPSEVGIDVPLLDCVVFLGEEDGQSYFAIDLPGPSPLLPEETAARGEFRDLRTVFGILDRRDGAILAYSKAIVQWHRRHRFCGDCGSPTVSSEGGHVRVCTNEDCAQNHFPRTDPAIIVLVSSGDHCLMGRQAVWPKNMYSTLAGFVEPGESLEDALVREVMEETSIKVKEVFYHSSQPWPFPGSLMLGFNARGKMAEIGLNDNELEDALWFTREEIVSRLRGGTLRLPTPATIAFRLIEDWFDDGTPGTLRGILGVKSCEKRPSF
ncbi:MAG: NAD(+) diphosphatase [Acidobacteriota bacterium]